MEKLDLGSERARTIWKSYLSSAFRTALACAVVGGITLYGPQRLRHQITLPAFSYVTVILIITDATLGDTFRGCWNALCATVQGVCPAIMFLWILGPGRLTTATTSMAVAVNAFVVVLPEKTHLIAKRIALGQIVLVYVIGFINGVRTDSVMHPVHVAASTALGVVACVLALVFPFPSLASYEVKHNCKLFTENASERLKLFVRAFCEEDNTSALALLSQAKSMATTATKLLQRITSKQESMKWERFPFKFLKPSHKNPGQRLQDIETPLMGMSIALSNYHSFPDKMLSTELKNGVHQVGEHIDLTFTQMKNCLPLDLVTVPESNADNLMKSLQTLQTVVPPSNKKELPSFFFLFCLKLLQDKLFVTSSNNAAPQKAEKSSDSSKDVKSFQEGIWRSLQVTMSSKSLTLALKCSLSLFLAVFLGLVYSKQDGYWSGLPVAISFVAAREATTRVANLKAQGTVLGTVYGVMGCFLFERYVKIRFISLLPWFIFTSLLRRSKMYGQAGGISAVIGAVLILGRRNFGTPSEFAIARIVETFIGLSCSIFVDVVFQPTRASTLARLQLPKSLESLSGCIGEINLSFSSMTTFGGSKKELKVNVNELGKFIAEAEMEPSFWLLPFNSSCYNKLLGSLSRMVNILVFGAHSIEFIEKELRRIDGNVCRETVTKLNGEIEPLKEIVGTSLKCLEKITEMKSLASLEKELQRKNVVSSCDIELGKSHIPIMFRSSDSDMEGEIEKIISSYLKISRELVGKIEDEEGEVKNQMVLGLSSLAFCMGILVKETKEIEKAIKELLQWENPSSHVNLNEIFCKIHALNN